MLIVPRQTSQNVITVGDWIGLSNDTAIHQRIADDAYSMAYPALLSHFQGIRIIDWDGAVLGLHIVYGWMPTIPRLGRVMSWGNTNKQLLVDCLSNAKSGNVPLDTQLEILKAFCNNSIVGGSKLLHFLNPDKFPIWDSRVAKAFWQKPKVQGQQVNSIKAWKTYRETLEKWISDPLVVTRCTALRKGAVFLNGATNLRLIELVLFHATISKRKLGKVKP